jgi:hypothetical protein
MIVDIDSTSLHSDGKSITCLNLSSRHGSDEKGRRKRNETPFYMFQRDEKARSTCEPGPPAKSPDSIHRKIKR